MATVEMFVTDKYVGPPILICIGTPDRSDWHHLTVRGAWTEIERIDHPAGENEIEYR